MNNEGFQPVLRDKMGARIPCAAKVQPISFSYLTMGMEL